MMQAREEQAEAQIENNIQSDSMSMKKRRKEGVNPGTVIQGNKQKNWVRWIYQKFYLGAVLSGVDFWPPRGLKNRTPKAAPKKPHPKTAPKKPPLIHLFNRPPINDILW